MSATDDFTGALIRAGSAVSFEHDGLIFSDGVPRECVGAYAAARLAKAPADGVLAALVAAYMRGLPAPEDDGRSAIWLCVRGWAARLAALERKVRGLAA